MGTMVRSSYTVPDVSRRTFLTHTRTERREPREDRRDVNALAYWTPAGIELFSPKAFAKQSSDKTRSFPGLLLAAD